MGGLAVHLFNRKNCVWPPLPPSCGLKKAIMHDDRVHHIEGPKGESVGAHYALFARGYGHAAVHEPIKPNLSLTLCINRRLVASNGQTHLRLDLLPVLRRPQSGSTIGRPRRIW